MKIRRDIVLLPNGQEKEWIYWDSADSVMVIGVFNGKLIMIEQYRYLVNNTVIEFPSGGLKPKEKSEDGAKREFEEETGYSCGNLVKLGSFYETYGQLNRQIHIYFTDNVTKTKQSLDNGEEYEDIKVFLAQPEDILLKALDNKIVAMGSSLAILLAKEKGYL